MRKPTRAEAHVIAVLRRQNAPITHAELMVKSRSGRGSA